MEKDSILSSTGGVLGVGGNEKSCISVIPKGIYIDNQGSYSSTTTPEARLEWKEITAFFQEYLEMKYPCLNKVHLGEGNSCLICWSQERVSQE